MDGLTRTFTDEFITDTVQNAIEITERLRCPEALLPQAFNVVLTMVGNMQVEQSGIAVPQLHTPGRML